MKDKNETEKQLAEKLLAKYQKEYDSIIVMDDYDGGRKEALRVVIEDLQSSMWWTM